MQPRAEKLAATLPPLLVAAQRVAATVAQGVHGRRRVGQGETFWQYRRYVGGDSTRAIDWRRSAKGDQVFVRETEWEAAQSVWLWRDTSASMRWRSARTLPEKAERAEILLRALALLLIGAGERVALLGEGGAAGIGKAAMVRLSHGLENPVSPEAGLPEFEPLPRHAEVVIIGDLFSSLDEIRVLVGKFVARGVRGHLLQVIDPAEETLPFTGRVRFDGTEGEESALLPRVESVRGDYAARFAEHREGLAHIARTAGWFYSAHHTDRSAESGLLTLYGALARERMG